MSKRLKILHITPTYFSKDSIMGGGEKYVIELAKAMSADADLKILSFNLKNQNYFEGPVEYIIRKPIFYFGNNLLNPFYLNMFNEFKNADVIHVHQMFNVLADVCILWARLLNKPIFLTDHGGGGVNYLTRLGISRLANGILSVSYYSKNKLINLNKNIKVIYGGIDQSVFFPHGNIQRKAQKIITVGRILPHKGLHHLINAIDSEELVIIGSCKDSKYLSDLKKLSLGKNVSFLSNVDEKTLISELANSSLAVFPSTNIGISNEVLSGEPELLGIAPLEAMALNTPTIVSNIGAYPEIAFDKEIFMFQHGNCTDLKNKIKYVLNKTATEKMDFQLHVQSQFTWKSAANKCLNYYLECGGKK
jgi:glycosyltransferase involved in cell wall biosynthesis